MRSHGDAFVEIFALGNLPDQYVAWHLERQIQFGSELRNIQQSQELATQDLLRKVLLYGNWSPIY